MTMSSIATLVHPTLRMRVPGLLLAVGIGLLALLLGRWAPLIGGPVIGIVLGIVVRNLCRRASATPPASRSPARRCCSGRSLRWASGSA